MALDRTISGLKLLKPVVKLIPVAGTYLEGVVDVIQQSCEIAKVGDFKIFPAQIPS
jgi:nitrogen regulatory protein PII